jgi:dienelactone hydrolase
LKQIQKDNKEDAIRLTKEILKNADETLKLIASIRAELKKDKPQYSEVKIEELTEIGELSFESPMPTPYEVNNTVHAKYYPSNRKPKAKVRAANRKSKKAIILIHHRGGNIDTLDAMAKIFANRGISALTMLMPYHGIRAPEGTKSGEFFTSANIKLTIDAFRQAVLEIHWATDWLQTLHSQIGIVGISLGGIVATLACAHDDRLKTACICHSGADLAAVTFRGIATRKIKEAFEKVKITEDELRTYWKAIDPVNYIHKMKETQLLQLNTIQDTVFPLSCQKKLSLAFKKSNVRYKLALFPFPCGHYSAGKYLLPKLYLLAKVFFFAKRHL